MKFKNFIKKHFDVYSFSKSSENDPLSISLYPVDEYNLEGIKLLVDSCKRAGSENNNVRMATVDPLIWIGDFLDKYWNKISFVSNKLEFSVYKIEEEIVINRKYVIKTKEIDDSELDEFFKDGKYRRLVLFSVVKVVNLISLTSFYKIRYSEINTINEIRDEKIKDIIS